MAIDILKKYLLSISQLLGALSSEAKSLEEQQRLRETGDRIAQLVMIISKESSFEINDSSRQEFVEKLREVQEYVKSCPKELVDIPAVLSVLDAVTDAFSPKFAQGMGLGEGNVPRLKDLLGKNDKLLHDISAASTESEKKKARKSKDLFGKSDKVFYDISAASTEFEKKAKTRESKDLFRESDKGFHDILAMSVESEKKLQTRKRVVNTGLALQTIPDDEIDKRMSLKTGELYYFWVEISEPRKESIEETPADIPLVATRARLTVVVFGFQDGLLITPGADVGEMEMQEDGTVKVVTQPLVDSPPASCHLAQRLFFPVRCPAAEGTFKMRCNIYSGQVLLQTREIHARVAAEPCMLSDGEWALRSVLDYTLSQRLNPALITQLTEHRLSILLNSNGDGTNSFHVYGSKGDLKFKKDDIRFEEGKLHKFIELARGSLRIASWDSKEEWKEGTPFKYQDRKQNLVRLSKDLISMAQWGHEFYIPFKIKTEFEEVLYEPSLIQIAMKDSPSYVLPAAMIYDYPIDVGADDLTICQSFADAFNRGDSLEDHECFRGNCPSRKERKTVCPSGFWGFRHYIGMPLSIEKKSNEEDTREAYESDASTSIHFTDNLNMVAGVATDFRLLLSHETAINKLKPNLVCQYADTRDKVFELLRSSPHLVYFYCHGALLRDELSYLQVGIKDKIFPSNFDVIKWEDPRPLVFMNGCHTIDPIGALSFIEPLVQLSKCAGVIGTEITIYEEMATVFAEEFFHRFLGEEAVGMAIRNARLKLLEEGNPLGLSYIPYAIAGLKIERQQ